jgi:hypothetical protein
LTEYFEDQNLSLEELSWPEHLQRLEIGQKKAFFSFHQIDRCNGPGGLSRGSSFNAGPSPSWSIEDLINVKINMVRGSKRS